MIKGIRNIFRKADLDIVNLKWLLKEDNDLVENYIANQNKTFLRVASILIVLVNTFWLFSLYVFSDRGRSSATALGISGIVLGVIVSAVTLALTWPTRNTRTSTIRIMLIVFHIGMVLTVLGLEISKSYVIAATVGTTNSVSLSVYWLILLVMLPIPGLADSIAVMTILGASVFVPFLVCPKGSYSLASNAIIAACIIPAYFAFRSSTFKTANLVKSLADTSYKDYQTSMLNRRAMKEYFSMLPGRGTSCIGVMAFDIDDLKRYNDMYSYSRGDEVLEKISCAVDKALSDIRPLIFRYGGGEFIVAVEDIKEAQLLKAALKIKETVEGLKIERKDDPVRDRVTVTVGCTWAGKADYAGRDIVGDAETQLFVGKKGSKNCVVFKGRIYIDEGEIEMSQQPTLYTERVAQAVADAMKKGDIKAYFQPLYETVTHKLVGAEALARWVKDDGTLIQPSEFVPELEKNSSILDLDWYMFEQCCRLLRKQKDNDIPCVRLSVNFSRMHALYERSIEKRLCEIADSYGIQHSLIEIEITESAYIHLPSIIEPFIRKIRAEGFSVAVDDFGSGASSLEFIKSVDVDTLKIDRSLINSKNYDEKEKILLESVVLLAHRLQMNSVAEGVETPEQLGFLKTLGCNQIQGFIFAPPMDEKEFMEICSREATDSDEQDFIKTHRQSSTIKMLMDTVFKKYPVVLMANLSRNSFYSMTDTRITNHTYSRAGVLTDLLKEITSTIHPDDLPEFKRIFKLENQFRSFHEGEEKIVFTARIHGDEEPFVYKTVETTSYFIQETGNDDLLVITFFSEPVGVIS